MSRDLPRLPGYLQCALIIVDLDDMVGVVILSLEAGEPQACATSRRALCRLTVAPRGLPTSLPRLRTLSFTHPLNIVWRPIADTRLAMRRKFVTNAAINPLSALLGCRNGETVRDAAASRTCRRMY